MVVSGICMDFVCRLFWYMWEFVNYYVGGYFKIVFEYVDLEVFDKMCKLMYENFEEFIEVFCDELRKVGKK